MLIALQDPPEFVASTQFWKERCVDEHENMYNNRYYRSFHGVPSSSDVRRNSDKTDGARLRLTSVLSNKVNSISSTSSDSSQNLNTVRKPSVTAGLIRKTKRSNSSPCLDDDDNSELVKDRRASKPTNVGANKSSSIKEKYNNKTSVMLGGTVANEGGESNVKSKSRLFSSRINSDSLSNKTNVNKSNLRDLSDGNRESRLRSISTPSPAVDQKQFGALSDIKYEISKPLNASSSLDSLDFDNVNGLTCKRNNSYRLSGRGKVADLRNKFDSMTVKAKSEESTPVKAKYKLCKSNTEKAIFSKPSVNNRSSSGTNKRNASQEEVTNVRNVLRSSTLPDCTTMLTATKHSDSRSIDNKDKVSNVKLTVVNFENNCITNQSRKEKVTSEKLNDLIKPMGTSFSKNESGFNAGLKSEQTSSSLKLRTGSKGNSETSSVASNPRSVSSSRSGKFATSHCNDTSDTCRSDSVSLSVTNKKSGNDRQVAYRRDLQSKRSSSASECGKTGSIPYQMKTNALTSQEKTNDKKSSFVKLDQDSFSAAKKQNSKLSNNASKNKIASSHHVERRTEVIEKTAQSVSEPKQRSFLHRAKPLDKNARARLGKAPEPPKVLERDSKTPVPKLRKCWTDKDSHTYLNKTDLDTETDLESNIEADSRVNEQSQFKTPSEPSISENRLQKNELSTSTKSIPNNSFLWNHRGSVTSIDNSVKDGSSSQPISDSGDYFDDPYVYEENFGYESNELDEPIYMEANILDNKHTSELEHFHDSPVYAYMDITDIAASSSDYRIKESLDSDEGWVTESDNSDGTDRSKQRELYPKVTLRKKAGGKKSHRLERLSWSRSIQKLNETGIKNTDEKSPSTDQEGYQDVHDWEMMDDESVSSSSSMEHQYEALYDIINQSSIVSDVKDVDRETFDEIPMLPERDHSPWMTMKDKAISKDSGIGDLKSNTIAISLDSEATADNTGIAKIAGEKIRKIKRNWSLTKSDIRLELSSRWNRMKPKKTSKSAAEIGACAGIISKKVQRSQLDIQKINQLQTSKTEESAKISPSKETAHFYIRCSSNNSSTRSTSSACERPRSDSYTDGINAELSAASQARNRRVSLNKVIRPTVSPPLPPSDRTNLSDTSSQSDSKSSLYGIIWTCPDNANERETKSSLISPAAPLNKLVRAASQDSASSVASTNAKESIGNRKCLLSIGSLDSCSDSDRAQSSVSIKPVDISSGKNLRQANLKSNKDKGSYLQCSNTMDTPKSPVREGPLYQFYQEDVNNRVALWGGTGDTSGSDDDFDKVPFSYNKKEYRCSRQLSAMDIVKSETGSRMLWCEVPEVIESGILDRLSMQEKKLQEAMFELMTSEASYLKSLDVLVNHFINCPEFTDEFSTNCVLSRHEKHVLFSDVLPVVEVSQRLLADFESHWQKDILLPNICDILYEHATKYFHVYVKYCSNQLYQDRLFKQLKVTKSEFVEVLKRLESSSVCQSLSMHSFLMLPMQRITRLPLLVDAIYHRLEAETYQYERCQKTLVYLKQVVADCNEEARKMERMEEMLRICQQIDFNECKGVPLISPSRWLVKKGDLTRLNFPDSSTKISFGKVSKCTKSSVYLFLFTDLLIITRKKTDDSFIVLDYCPRNMVQVALIDDEHTLKLPCRPQDGLKNLFQCTMLNNHEGKTVELFFSCNLESERMRWIDAVTPPTSENPDEKIYEEWDCPQVQVIHSYRAQQPDELMLEESDVVNVFRKMADGWYQGERIRDGVQGWFPGNHTEEIVSSHVRARNLRQRYRLLALSHSYLLQVHKSRSK